MLETEEPITATLERVFGGFGSWMLDSRWYVERTFDRAPRSLARSDGRDAVAIFGSPPELAVSLPARVRCRYLRGADPGPRGEMPLRQRRLREWLADCPQDYDSVMGQLARATLYLVELILDRDAKGHAVCREATVRSPATPLGLRWAQYGAGVLLVDDSGAPHQPAKAGVIGVIPRMDVTEFAERYVGWWHRVTGTKLPKRRRGLTTSVIADALEVYRATANLRAVAESMGWYDPYGEPLRARARRAIKAAVEDDLLSRAEHAELRSKAPRGRPRKEAAGAAG